MLKFTKKSVVYVHASWQFMFFFIALGLLIIIGFWEIQDYRLTPAFNLSGYQDIFVKPQYLTAILNSVRLALITSLLSTCLALPVAHALTFYIFGTIRIVVFLLLLLPFFSNYIIRMFSWQIWLNGNGILSWICNLIGIHDFKGLLFSEMATIIGLLSLVMPITILFIFLSYRRLDFQHVQAAINLGATKWQAFIKIQLPVAYPGILIGSLFSFLIAIGDFICPTILGGNSSYYLSIAILDSYKINEWPMAAVLSCVMLTITLVVSLGIFYLISFLINKEDII